MALMYGSARRTTHAWLNAPLHETRLSNTNRFLPLADRPPSADELPSAPHSASSHLRKKKKNTSRRKRFSRGMKHARPVEKDDIDLFVNGPSYREAPMWEELPESYVPQLGVMLNETVTLDCLPRASPPVTVRPDKRRARRREDGDRFEDWDLVSNCSEESFFMV